MKKDTYTCDEQEKSFKMKKTENIFDVSVQK